MDNPVHRVTHSGISFGPHILGSQTIGGGREHCTSFKMLLAPLFLNALKTSDLRVERNLGDNKDMPLEDCPPLRQSPHLSESHRAPDAVHALAAGSISAPLHGSNTRSFTIARPGKVELMRNKDRSKDRHRRRKQQNSTVSIPAFRPRMTAIARYGDVLASRIPFEARLLPAGNWIGRRTAKLDGSSDGIWTLSELIGRGMEVKVWNGMESEIITNDQGRVMVFLVSRPSDPTWMSSCRNVAAMMTQARVEGKRNGSFKVGKKDLGKHRHGEFYAIPTGVSFGGGAVVPGNLKICPKLQGLVEGLCEHNDVRRIAGYQSGAFAFYTPKLYHNYHSMPQNYTTTIICVSHVCMTELLTSAQISPHAAFSPPVTFNLGPGTVTVDHTDYNNVAYGLCAITSLGNYDPTLGGHLILFDLGLVIQFPPGATVLIPSSILCHGNTPLVGEGAQRMSFTQYCAGGLFRWVDYGFQTGKTLGSTSAGKARKKEIDGKLEDRTTASLNLFSTVDGLASDRAFVFGRDMFHSS